MYNKLELLQERDHYAKSAQDVVTKAEKEGRLLNDEEQTLIDDCLAKSQSYDAQLQKVVAHETKLQQLEEFKAKLGSGRIATPEQPAPTTRPATPAVPTRNASLKAFRGINAEERAYRSGMWLRATVFGDVSAQRWCHNHGVFNALGTGSNSTGGYLVPEEFSQAIIDLREKYGVFRRETRVVPMGRDTLLVPRRVSGVSVSFVGENPSSGISESTPAFNQVRLTAKKLAGLVRMSSEVAEDAVVNLADWVANEFAYEFALKEDQCGFTGDGTSTYGGIQGVTSKILGLAGAVDAASGHDTFEEIDATDLAKLMAKLPEYARPGAKWYCSSVAWDLVFGRLMAAAGGNTIQTIEGGYSRSYLGYPVVISQVLPTATTDLSDVAMLLFGDLSLASTMGDRKGIDVMPSEHRYYELDQIAIRAIERFDIVVHDVGDASTAGPLVALIGE